MYVLDDQGERIECPHPLEFHIVSEVLGKDATQELIDKRTGFNSHCVCSECLEQFELDLDTDQHVCPACNSRDVKSTRELVGSNCPKCPQGKIAEEPLAIA
jgi:hypothetical protein